MNQYIHALNIRKDTLSICLTGLLFSACLLYVAYRIRNKSKIALIALTTMGVFISIFMTFAVIITLMTGVRD